MFRADAPALSNFESLAWSVKQMTAVTSGLGISVFYLPTNHHDKDIALTDAPYINIIKVFMWSRPVSFLLIKMSAPVPAKSICQAVLAVYLQICQGERYPKQVAFSQTSPEMVSSMLWVYLYACDANWSVNCRREQLSWWLGRDTQLRSFIMRNHSPFSSRSSNWKFKDESLIVLPKSVMLNHARIHTF